MYLSCVESRFIIQNARIVRVKFVETLKVNIFLVSSIKHSDSLRNNISR